MFSRIPTTNKVIFLGIDDGIVRDPAVVDLLKQANIPFTMFLVQSQADAGADYFRQLQQVGGWSKRTPSTIPTSPRCRPAQLQTEVCGTLDDYQTLFGRRPTLFRPPYGAYNDNVQAVAASCGFKAVVLWKGSTNDGRFDLQDGTQLTPGDIVLMHWRTDLLGNLQKVFDVCRQQGFARSPASRTTSPADAGRCGSDLERLDRRHHERGSSCQRSGCTSMYSSSSLPSGS